MPWDQFPGNRPNRPQSPNDVASRPLPKSPVSSSRDNVVPQMIVRSPRVRPGKFVFGEAKRVLQHYLPTAEATRTGEHWRGRQTAIAINSLAMGTAMRERDLSSRAVCVPLGPQVWRRGCGSRLPARSLETRGNEAPHSRHLIPLHFTNHGRGRRGRDDLVVLEQFTAQLANFLATQYHASHTSQRPYLGRPMKLHVQI